MNLFKKIFDPPNTPKHKDIRKLGMENNEREEGEVILLTILFKNSIKFHDPNFVTFLVEKVLIWSENG